MTKSSGTAALLLAACAVGTAGPPRREPGGVPGQVAPEVRRELFEQVSASPPGLRECVEAEAGGLKAAREEVTAGERT